MPRFCEWHLLCYKCNIYVYFIWNKLRISLTLSLCQHYIYIRSIFALKPDRQASNLCVHFFLQYIQTQRRCCFGFGNWHGRIYHRDASCLLPWCCWIRMYICIFNQRASEKYERRRRRWLWVNYLAGVWYDVQHLVT